MTVHHEVLRAQLNKYKGVEMQIDGDAVLLGFRDPVSAIAWCLATQQVCISSAQQYGTRLALDLQTQAKVPTEFAELVYPVHCFFWLLAHALLLTCGTTSQYKCGVTSQPCLVCDFLHVHNSGATGRKLAKPASEAQADQDSNPGWSHKEHCHLTASAR